MKQGFRRLSKQDKKDIGTRLDQKKGYRSSLEKLDHSICQTGQSGFQREKCAQNIFHNIFKAF
jgi:hypothetical protein